MSTRLDVWFWRRRLKKSINQATRAIYSQKYKKLDDLVAAMSNANPDVIHLAIYAVFRIKEEMEKLDFEEVSLENDKKPVRIVMEECLSVLREIATNVPERVALHREMNQAQAAKAFAMMQLVFQLASDVDEETYGGAISKAEKIKHGPLTPAERRRFKILTTQLKEAEQELQELDEALPTHLKNSN